MKIPRIQLILTFSTALVSVALSGHGAEMSEPQFAKKAGKAGNRLVGVSCVCSSPHASPEEMEKWIDRAALDKPDIILLTEGCMQNTRPSASRQEKDAQAEPLPEFGPITTLLARKAKQHNTYIIFARINLDSQIVHIDYNADRVARLKEKYGPYVSVETASPEAVYFLSSLHPDKTIEEMIEEFEIETLDEYLDRSRGVRKEHLPKEEK
jgi:hypothetical protein